MPPLLPGALSGSRSQVLARVLTKAGAIAAIAWLVTFAPLAEVRIAAALLVAVGVAFLLLRRVKASRAPQVVAALAQPSPHESACEPSAAPEVQARPSPARPRKIVPAAVRVEYVGFVSTGLGREYSLVVGQEGTTESKTFVLVIADEAFTSRNARYQDGPDICYQKLLATLSSSPAPLERIALSEEDLHHYRHAHAPKGSRHRVLGSPLVPSPGRPHRTPDPKG